MIKFRLYSSKSESINKIINLLSSVALGNFIFEEDNNEINCKVTDDVDTYLLGRIRFDENNLLEVTDDNNLSLPTEEPTKSYSLAILELIRSLDGKSYNYSIEFLNKLSNNGKI